MSDSHILCNWTWNSSRSKLDSAGSSPDGMIRPNSLVIHFWILSRVPSYQYVPQSDQDTGLILDILLSSLISSVQNWFMKLMNEIQIPCNDHSIPDSQQSHIPWLPTISLGFNHPDLPSILQVLVSTFRASYMSFPLTRWDFSLLFSCQASYFIDLSSNVTSSNMPSLTVPCKGKISLLFSIRTTYFILW